MRAISTARSTAWARLDSQYARQRLRLTASSPAGARGTGSLSPPLGSVTTLVVRWPWAVPTGLRGRPATTVFGLVTCCFSAFGWGFSALLVRSCRAIYWALYRHDLHIPGRRRSQKT